MTYTRRRRREACRPCTRPKGTARTYFRWDLPLARRRTRSTKCCPSRPRRARKDTPRRTRPSWNPRRTPSCQRSSSRELRRRQQPGETFDSFVTDLKLLARGLHITETKKLIRNAIACKSLNERVRQRWLEKSKNLTLETVIDMSRMFEEPRTVYRLWPEKTPKSHARAQSSRATSSIPKRRSGLSKPKRSRASE